MVSSYEEKRIEGFPSIRFFYTLSLFAHFISKQSNKLVCWV